MTIRTPSATTRVAVFSLFITVLMAVSAEAKKSTNVWTDASDKSLPADFALQGEYIGKLDGKMVGCQVIALGKGQFHAVVYPGGLPGAGWDGKAKSLMHGTLADGAVNFTPATGKRAYIAGPADKFSATRKFPPAGHEAFHAVIKSGNMTLKNSASQTADLMRVERKSPTLGAKPPKGASILFSGQKDDMTHWQGGRFDAKTKLLNTDGRDIRTAKKFSNYTMHIEFMLPYRPDARGQGRGNSGFYQVDHYEVQILDSFGLDGKKSEWRKVCALQFLF